MATNVFFNNYHHSNTQNLVDNLVVESIKQKGLDVNYIPRDVISYDEILGEGGTYKFANNFIIEMIIENVEQWGGQGEIFSKFGLQLNDECTLNVSKSRFITCVKIIYDNLNTLDEISLNRNLLFSSLGL